MAARKDGLATFAQVQAFLKSWGLYPVNEDTDDLNPEAVHQGINKRCYEKLIIEAKGYNSYPYFRDYFQTFISREIDATDDMFYLGRASWAALEEDYTNYIAGL